MEIISRLFDGGYVDYTGNHFRIDSAKLWDLPEQRVPIAGAVSGPQSIELLAPWCSAMIAVEPEAELISLWDKEKSDSTRKIGQLPVCYDTDRAAATQYVTEVDVAASIPCGPDIDRFLEAATPFWQAGFTHLALVQIGGEHQDEFLDAARRRPLPALRDAAGH